MGVHALSGDEPPNGEGTPAMRDAHDIIEPKALDEARLRQQAIGVRLRQMFDAVVNEDVPEEFLDILKRADERGSEASG